MRRKWGIRMKDDYGNKWTRKDYLMAVIVTILLIVAICIPALILLGFNWLTGWKYHWIAWGVIMIGLFVFNIWLDLKPKHTPSTKGNI